MASCRRAGIASFDDDYKDKNNNELYLPAINNELYLPCYQIGKSPILLLAEEMLEQREHSLMVSLPNELEQMETGPTEQISNQQSLPSGAIHVDTLVSAW